MLRHRNENSTHLSSPVLSLYNPYPIASNSSISREPPHHIVFIQHHMPNPKLLYHLSRDLYPNSIPHGPRHSALIYIPRAYLVIPVQNSHLFLRIVHADDPIVDLVHGIRVPPYHPREHIDLLHQDVWNKIPTATSTFRPQIQTETCRWVLSTLMELRLPQHSIPQLFVCV